MLPFSQSYTGMLMCSNTLQLQSQLSYYAANNDGNSKLDENRLGTENINFHLRFSKIRRLTFEIFYCEPNSQVFMSKIIL
jgi:hypothetical protein